MQQRPFGLIRKTPVRIQPDVVQYIQDALEQFKSMEVTQIQKLSLELTLPGNKGLNINDQTWKYQIKAWPGERWGLHLISIMYAAFQQFAPDTDVGIDLSQEYRIAAKGGQ